MTRRLDQREKQLITQAEETLHSVNVVQRINIAAAVLPAVRVHCAHCDAAECDDLRAHVPHFKI